MKTISLALAAVLSVSATMADAQAVKPLKKVMELIMPEGGGANGAAVAWHPVQQKYYAAMAGNATYTLGVFSAAGKLLSPEDQITFFDIRGLWYNPAKKTLQMNGYNENGWAEYKLVAKGFPDTVTTLYTGMLQPSEQSTGAFNPKENIVYFLNDDGKLDKYSMKDGIYLDVIELHPGKAKLVNASQEEDHDEIDLLENYNKSTVIFTGTTGTEIGLLNHAENQIELYNIKTGLLTKKFSFPADAPVPQFLNFSYTNGIYWLFDKEARTWKGYK
ncbi:MAG: hypothetical protein JNK14_21350 [Chitinophagaceae bacterium]|nr:hypothetical protein [Chitinophagaceae bacterium]